MAALNTDTLVVLGVFPGGDATPITVTVTVAALTGLHVDGQRGTNAPWIQIINSREDYLNRVGLSGLTMSNNQPEPFNLAAGATCTMWIDGALYTSVRITASGLTGSNATAVASTTIDATPIGSATRSTGAFTSLSANLASNVVLAGTGTALTAPILQLVNSVNSFTQLAAQNMTAGVSASADVIAYPNNNTNDTSGFVDIGVCSSTFADSAYTITGPNDAYLFGSAVSGSGFKGNLVICTDSTGAFDDIVFGTGGFLVANIRARIKGNAALNLTPLAAAPTVNVAEGDIYYDLTLHKLRVRTASAWETVTSV